MKALLLPFLFLLLASCDTGVSKNEPMDNDPHTQGSQRPAPGDSTGESLRTTPAVADTDSVH